MRTTTWAALSLLVCPAFVIQAAEPPPSPATQGPVSASAIQQLTAWASAITARIHRAWAMPPSAAAGIQCVVYVTQEPGGRVSNVRIGACSGDQAVRESIEQAVYRASPLPPPPDPTLFDPNLTISFYQPSSSAPAQRPPEAAPITPPSVSRTPADPTFSGHHAGETFRDCADVCPRMVVIAPGSFRMGSPDDEQQRFDAEGPVHEVRIGYAFAVSKYPITRGEWKQFVKETGHKDGSDCLKGGQQDNRPVVCVDWQDAQDYAGWLSRKSGHRYRLLSEAEYEYVNRAGSQTVYFWGNSYDRRYANDGLGTTAVGSFKPNAFGLYDTTGNVWSWTQDCYHSNYNGAPTDGSAWDPGDDCSAGRVVRGRPWYGSQPRWMRSASRGWSDGFDGGGGFRLARD